MEIIKRPIEVMSYKCSECGEEYSYKDNAANCELRHERERAEASCEHEFFFDIGYNREEYYFEVSKVCKKMHIQKRKNIGV